MSILGEESGFDEQYDAQVKEPVFRQERNEELEKLEANSE